MLVVNPKYEYLRSWLEQLPDTFVFRGEVIYDARNQIRLIDSGNSCCGKLCVKRFHCPALPNRIIYSCLRQPKAKRAYENARRLEALHIGTPTPVAYLLQEKRSSLIGESYLITEVSPLKRNFYEFRAHGIEGYEHIIRQFAQFTADLHGKGVLHKDYSPGNILFDVDAQGNARFELVDINRMRFGKPVSMRTACRNFCRLWGKEDFFVLLAEVYAEARGFNKIECRRLTLMYWRRFWRYRK